MTWTLAIDTATVVEVALAHDGALVGECRVEDTRRHTEDLMPLVVGLCTRAGIALTALDEFVVGVGPGPFTGLRVGIVTARTLAALAGTEAHGVCSLDVVAREAWARGLPGGTSEFVTLIDARRAEVYWSRYGADSTRLEGPRVSAPAELPDLPVTGPGTSVLGTRGVERSVFGSDRLPAARMATDWAQLPAAGLEPLYLRTPDATVPSARKSTLLPVRRRHNRGRAR